MVLMIAKPAKTRTQYPKSVKDPRSFSMLKKGSNNKKLGYKITAKKWKGKRLYSLTLEERTTCPTSCHHWDDCYGNNMPFAHRFDTKNEYVVFLPKLRAEVQALCAKHPEGVVIRLHVLGDFFSVNYVHFWERMLIENPGLAVFGYTAREPHTDIGAAIQSLNKKKDGRFQVRQSRNKERDADGFYAADESFEGECFDCPEQKGLLPDCASCGACWMTTKTVRFKTH